MATVVFDGTRLDSADTIGTAWTVLGLAKAATAEPDFIYQNTGSASNKVKTTEEGVAYVHTAAVDLTASTLIFKHIATTSNILNNEGATGGILEVGSGTTRANYYRYYVVGGNTYPPKGGWLITPIDPNVSAHRDATIGTPAIGSARFFAFAATFTASSKVENVAVDALDYITSGTGLTLTGTAGTIANFVSADEGTLANRWGLVTTGAEEVAVFGTLTIGTATLTTFADSNVVISFPGGRFAAGFSGLAFGMSNASQDIALTDSIIKGGGAGSRNPAKSNRKVYFDTIAEIDPTPDEITIVGGHGYVTGDAVLYSKEGGSGTTGLTNATEYWIEVVTSTTLNMHTSRQNAITGATPIALSDSSATESHSLTRQPDTRPDIVYTGTSGVGSKTGCTFNTCRNITLTSVITHTDCTYLQCGTLTLAQGILTGANVSGSTTNPGQAFIVTPDLGDITGATIVASKGHAVEITATGTFSWAGNTTTGFWSHGNVLKGQGATFNASTGVNGSTEVISTDETHGFTNGDEVYYSDEGGTAIGGLTDQARYFARALSTTTVSMHRTKADAVADTNRIDITAGTSQEHALYSAHATILNSSGAAVTINVSTGATIPTMRNTAGSTTTVVASVPVTVTVLDTSGNPIENAQVYVQDAAGPFNDSSQIIRELTNASGIATEDFSGTTPLAITIRVRKTSTGSTRYIPVQASGTITTTGFSTVVTLTTDTIASA